MEIKRIEKVWDSMVKEGLLKIKIVKGSSNVTPVVYSYKLAAKVKQVWTYQQYRKEDF